MTSHGNGRVKSSDDRVLEVIFNPELPAEELEVKIYVYQLDSWKVSTKIKLQFEKKIHNRFTMIGLNIIC